VIVYVETNFVLELALIQEQQASCEEILRLSEAGSFALVIPAYSLVEPYETLVRRHRQRKELKADLDIEIDQLTRTASYSDRRHGFQGLSALLIDSAEEETKRLEELRQRLLKICHVIQLDAARVETATRYQNEHSFSPQDALIYASVVSHLHESASGKSCFLNRNARDFDDPDIVEELRSLDCRLIARFDDGLEHLRHHIRTDDASS
jgi:predicted nucleic acid-binding protein